MENMSKRIQEESENGTKNVCYIIVTHDMWVDQMNQMFGYLM